MNRQEERRKDYESPRTRMVQVETEGNLCGSVTDDKHKGVEVKAAPQEYEEVTADDKTFTWE